MLNKEIKKILEDEVVNYNIASEPYFQSLLNGSMSKEIFLKTQEQFSYLVEYYSRPMALIVTNIDDEIARMKIVENLWEEHGNGIPDKIHGKTILQFIDSIGGDSSSLDNKNTNHVIETFNLTLRAIANFEDYRKSVAFFAGIERIFVEVSSTIAEAVLKQKWLKDDEIVHYGLHKEIDIQHAEDFLKVVEDSWADTQTKSLVKKGIRQGINIFLNVYSGLYKEYMNLEKV